jgi:hypothetical protein
MARKFYVPKFITIEDKLMGLVNFVQLFTLLGAFLISFFIFKINQTLGFFIGIILFLLAFILTFINLNGKPVYKILPSIIDSFLNKKFTWQKIEKFIYKEITLPLEIQQEAPSQLIALRKKIKKEEPVEVKIVENIAQISLRIPETNIKEEINLSLDQPISNQIEKIYEFKHRHFINPKNPYRFFPYIKFYKTIK